MFIVTRECWSGPQKSAMPHWRSIPATSPSALAPGPSWNWVTRRGPGISSAWTPARNGPLMSCRRFSYVRAKSRKPRKPSSKCPLLLDITAICWKLACNCGQRQSWTGLRRSWKPTRRPKRILRSCTTKGPCWDTAAKSRLRSICCRVPSSGTIARTPISFLTRCWQSCVPIQPLTRCYPRPANARRRSGHRAMCRANNEPFQWPISIRRTFSPGCRALLPPHAFAQCSDVRQVVRRVPRVHGQHLVERKHSTLGMVQGPCKLRGLHRPQQIDPPGMERGQQLQRHFNRGYAVVGQLGPQVFVVGLDGGPVFGKRKFETDVGVQVTIGYMMHHLPYAPALGTIRRVELNRAQISHRSAHLPWQLG